MFSVCSPWGKGVPPGLWCQVLSGKGRVPHRLWCQVLSRGKGSTPLLSLLLSKVMSQILLGAGVGGIPYPCHLFCPKSCLRSCPGEREYPSQDIVSGARSFPGGRGVPPSPVTSPVQSHVPDPAGGRGRGYPLPLSLVLSKVLSQILPGGRGYPSQDRGTTPFSPPPTGQWYLFPDHDRRYPCPHRRVSIAMLRAVSHLRYAGGLSSHTLGWYG